MKARAELYSSVKKNIGLLRETKNNPDHSDACTHLVESVRSEFVHEGQILVDQLPEGTRGPVAVSTASESTLQRNGGA